MLNDINVKIELHFSLSSFLPKDLKHLLDNPFKNAIIDQKNKYRYHLSNDDETLYFIVHTAKHIRSAQFWYNTIIDYYYLKNNINHQLINKARLTKFYDTLDNYIKHIFNKSSLSKEGKTLEELLFINNGKLNKVINIRKNNKLKYILSRIFVPNHELKKKYLILNKYPILFPFLSVVRWFTLPFKISKEGRQELEALKKENDELILKLKQIGLEEYLINQELK